MVGALLSIFTLQPTLLPASFVSTIFQLESELLKIVQVIASIPTLKSLINSHSSTTTQQQNKRSVCTSETCLNSEDEFILNIALHKSGESTSCASLPISSLDIQPSSVFPPDFTPPLYQFDADFTFALIDASSAVMTNCKADVAPVRSLKRDNSFLAFCDMGVDKTPMQFDSNLLKPLPSPHRTLPCSYYTREGVRVRSFEELKHLALSHTAEFRIYAVPAGRQFMFAPGFIGEEFVLNHVGHPENKVVSLRTLSVSPKVFEINNFFLESEADDIVARALASTSETHKLKRSSTGSDGYSVNPTRTSENAFDTHGASAMNLKKRCFETLGMTPYQENMADGLQILRYNLTTAYIGHLDYIDDSALNPHNFDTAGTGSNRYSTILLYMTDLEDGDGGETVWSNAWPDVDVANRIPFSEALASAKADGSTALFDEGSWQEKMVAECRSRMAFQPKRAKAVLFYSQLPDGRVDNMSKHGACPVLKGEKWAANLWVWNAPRMGYSEAPQKPNFEAPPETKGNAKTQKEAKSAGETSIRVGFENTGAVYGFEDATLFYEETKWMDELGLDKTVWVNSFPGHRWYVRVGDKVVESLVVEVGREENEVFQF